MRSFDFTVTQLRRDFQLEYSGLSPRLHFRCVVLKPCVRVCVCVCAQHLIICTGDPGDFIPSLWSGSVWLVTPANTGKTDFKFDSRWTQLNPRLLTWMCDVGRCHTITVTVVSGGTGTFESNQNGRQCAALEVQPVLYVHIRICSVGFLSRRTDFVTK